MGLWDTPAGPGTGREKLPLSIQALFRTPELQTALFIRHPLRAAKISPTLSDLTQGRSRGCLCAAKASSAK